MRGAGVVIWPGFSHVIVPRNIPSKMDLKVAGVLSQMDSKQKTAGLPGGINKRVGD